MCGERRRQSRFRYPGRQEREIADQLRVLREGFIEAMDDDFNTARASDVYSKPSAFSTLLSPARTFKSLLPFSKSSEKRSGRPGRSWGCSGEEPYVYLRQDRERETSSAAWPSGLKALIAARREARNRKEWARADEIRKNSLPSGG